MRKLLTILAVLVSAAAMAGGPVTPPTPIATTTTAGKVKCDGSSVTCAPDGTITAHAGGSSGITTLTGDVTAGPGTGSQAATLAATGSAGTYGDATHVPQVTFDSKGRETGATSVVITQPTGANPTGTAGASAVNGSAATYMRSDAAPAVSPCASGAAGLVPATGGGTANFLRADCTFAAPAGSGTVTSVAVAPGLTTVVGTRNTSSDSITSTGTVYPQLYPVAKSASYTVNADNGGTSDTGALLYATAGSVTFTAPNPAAGTKGNSYSFGNDGTHSYVLATVGASATFYGSTHCTGATTASIGANTAVAIVDDGTNYQCVEATASSSAAGVPAIPQGRLSLSTGKPVMQADVTAATTLYYDSYVGNQVPVWNGSSMVGLTIASDEISMGLSATNHLANSFFSVFAVSNSGTPALCTVSWTNGTTPGAAATSLKNGVWTISSAPTHCYGGAAGATDLASAIGGANQATELGCMATTANNGQTAMQFAPASVNLGPNAWRGITNNYNQVIQATVGDDNGGGSSWTIAGTTLAPIHGSNANRINYFDCHGQIPVEVSIQASNAPAVGSFDIYGVCLNATTCGGKTTNVQADSSGTTGRITLSFTDIEAPTLGFNFVQAVEAYITTAGTDYEANLIAKLGY
jgi:hypothetical protein